MTYISGTTHTASLVAIMKTFTVYLLASLFLCGWCQEGEGIFENVVKDLFSKELSSANSNNMTDCMTRLLCENICHRTEKGEIKGEPLINSARMLGRTESDPLGYFFTGGDKGYELGRQKQCHLCAHKYPNCLSSDYEHVKSTSGNAENNMLKGEASSMDGDFMPFD